MALEIERKWLIDATGLPFDLGGFPHHRIVQSYVSFDPQIRLRSFDDERFILTIKGSPADDESGIVRIEHEFEISRESYEHLSTKTEGKTLIKTRYFIPEIALDEGATGTRLFEIDVYEGEFAGLAVAEMEFADLAQAQTFPSPSWVQEDISTDPYYRNVVMARS